MLIIVTIMILFATIEFLFPPSEPGKVTFGV